MIKNIFQSIKKVDKILQKSSSSKTLGTTDRRKLMLVVKNKIKKKTKKQKKTKKNQPQNTISEFLITSDKTDLKVVMDGYPKNWPNILHL